ncbi:cytochrome P450 [Actinomycetospora rhizophila]|uniref:Cytochrome P450 n=1 Tax=Actinomycetospora rhizophila TaxID=1416876 RepID=A0ABV9ZBQ3_9PSEU
MADKHPRPPGARPIPGPPGHPVVGNLLDLPRGRMVRAMTDLALRYGPMMKINILGGDRYVASGVEMFDDLCDETRFAKFVATPQRTLGGALPTRGLFTSESDDPLWKSAHEVLLPAFSMRAIRGYTPLMIDIADQLMLKWERLNPGEPVDVTADTTRLTLDTIALCGFGYRFNSFYRDSRHPFVEAMMVMLAEGQARLRLPAPVVKARRGARRRFDDSVELMTSTVQGIIDERRDSGEPGDDLLGCMLAGRDKDGARLPDRDIVSQCITFLIAGHETTSGLLAFAIHFLSRRPEVAQQARDEVDAVLGTDPTVPPSDAQLGRLTYLSQILEETLRLWPTAPAFFRRPLEDTTVGGYEFAAGTPIMALSMALHRRPDVWGADAELFDPDRFTPERRAVLPPNAYKPFGTGARACIGRQFALQEAVLVLAMIVQRFDLVADPGYALDVRESMTIKPQGLMITVVPRRGLRPGSARAAPVTAPPRRPSRPRRRARSPSPTGTARRCWCCSGRTWGRPRTSRAASPATAPTAGGPRRWPSSTTGWAISRARAPW